MSHARLGHTLREHPIVITGTGAWSAAGTSVDALWDAADRGRSSAISREFPTAAGSRSFPVCAAPPIPSPHPTAHRFRRLDRCIQMAGLAAEAARSRARLLDAYSRDRVGIMVGSSRGPLEKIHESFQPPGRRGPAPSLAADATFASVSGALVQHFQYTGPGAMISATCASAAFAIAFAAEQIVLGRADAMIVGGAEAPLHLSVLSPLSAAGVLGSHEVAAQACRPFDATRDGMVLGEGSAFLVLESFEGAVRRGAVPLARLAGWSVAPDDCGRTGMSPDGAGLVRVMRDALALAGLTPDAIDYINAHGSATRLNDSAEARAVRAVFGDRTASLPCTSTKPITGHCLGATPALEAVLCVESLLRQRVPPTANCRSPDPECPVHMVPGGAVDARIRTVMSNSIGFWGYHASLIFAEAP